MAVEYEMVIMVVRAVCRMLSADVLGLALAILRRVLSFNMQGKLRCGSKHHSVASTVPCVLKIRHEVTQSDPLLAEPELCILARSAHLHPVSQTPLAEGGYRAGAASRS